MSSSRCSTSPQPLGQANASLPLGVLTLSAQNVPGQQLHAMGHAPTQSMDDENTVAQNQLAPHKRKWQDKSAPVSFLKLADGDQQAACSVGGASSLPGPEDLPALVGGDMLEDLVREDLQEERAKPKEGGSRSSKKAVAKDDREKKEAAKEAERVQVQREASAAAKVLGEVAKQVPTAEEITRLLDKDQIKALAAALSASRAGGSMKIAQAVVEAVALSTDTARTLGGACGDGSLDAALVRAASTKVSAPKRSKSTKWRDSRQAQDESNFAVELKKLRSRKGVEAVTMDDLSPAESEALTKKKADARKQLEAIAEGLKRESGGQIVGWWEDGQEPCPDEYVRNRCAFSSHH